MPWWINTGMNGFNLWTSDQWFHRHGTHTKQRSIHTTCTSLSVSITGLWGIVCWRLICVLDYQEVLYKLCPMTCTCTVMWWWLESGVIYMINAVGVGMLIMVWSLNAWLLNQGKKPDRSTRKFHSINCGMLINYKNVLECPIWRASPPFSWHLGWHSMMQEYLTTITINIVISIKNWEVIGFAWRIHSTTKIQSCVGLLQ